jgi:hypothetical protein
MEEWWANDPQAAAHDASRVFKATLLSANSKTGMTPLAALNALGQKEGIADTPEFKTLMAMVNNITARADQAPPKATPKGPDEAKLTAREQKIRQDEWNVEKRILGDQARPTLIREAKNALKSVMGGRKLSDQSMKDLLTDTHVEFARLTGKQMDPDGFAKRQKLLAAGDGKGWVKLSETTAKRTYLKAARNVWRKYAGISGLSTQQKNERRSEAGQRREAGGGGASTAAVLETKKPGSDKNGRTTVDWDAMRAKLGGRDAADEAFSFGSKAHGGKRVWIEKETGKMYTY